MIEDILPVSMDVSQKKVLPKGALAIILHTCEFAEGNTWGKRITKQAIKVLGAQDEVGVLAYTSTGEQWLFELTPAGEYESLVPLINGAQIGDMPSFQNTMSLGLRGLLKSDAATRHMIIISDGDPQPPTPALVKEFLDGQVSVSMVAIFPHGGSGNLEDAIDRRSDRGPLLLPGRPQSTAGDLHQRIEDPEAKYAAEQTVHTGSGLSFANPEGNRRDARTEGVCHHDSQGAPVDDDPDGTTRRE